MSHLKSHYHFTNLQNNEKGWNLKSTVLSGHSIMIDVHEEKKGKEKNNEESEAEKIKRNHF